LTATLSLCAFECAFADPVADDADDRFASIDRLLINHYAVDRLPPDTAQIAPPAISRELTDHYLYFAGTDIWRHGRFLHGGVVWSPDGLDRQGFTLKLLLAGGRYLYRSGINEIAGDQFLAAAMPGWRFKIADLEVVALAGIDVQNHRLSLHDPSNRLRGTHVGVRTNVDVWYQPSEILMAAMSFSGSTLGTNIWSRAALGVKVFGQAWVGPEVIAFTDEKYREFRFGAHITALRAGMVELSVGAGYVRDSDHRSGAYGRLGVLTRQ
jgi:hypothetical protein